MTSVRQLFGQTGVYGLGTVLPRFLNYLLTPLYTYLFTNPAEYGINAEVYAYISFLNIIFTYGMETSYFRFSNQLNDTKKVFDNALSLIILSTVIFSCVLFAFSGTIVAVLKYQNILFIYWTIGIIASDALLSIPFAYLRQEQKAMRFSLLKMINVLINVVLNLFFFLVCKGSYDEGKQSIFSTIYEPSIGIGYSFLSNLLANVVSLFLLFPVWKKFQFQIDIDLSKKILLYALPLLVVGLAGMINETFDRIILKYLLPASVAQYAQGVYGACYKISILMSLFIQAYRYAAEPIFFKAFKENDSKVIYAKTTDIFIAFALVIWLGTVLNLPVLQYFIGPSYRVGLKVVPVLLTANLFLGIYFNFSFWYKLTGQTQIGAYITMMGAIITLAINFAFVPEYAYVASAWATFAAYFTMMMMAYLLGQKYYKIKYPISKIVFNIFLVVIIFILSNQFNFSSHVLKIIVNNIFLILFVLYIAWRYKIHLIYRNFYYNKK